MTNSSNVVLDGLSLKIGEVVSIARDFSKVEISSSARERVVESRRVIEGLIGSGKIYYGINTGFGKLADTLVSGDDLEQLQINLLRSHSVGLGPFLTEEEGRALMVLRLNSLLRGNSGVRYDVIEQLCSFLNTRIFPAIPSYGSLGASGDLAPSAHLALCMIGEGNVFVAGETVSTDKVLRENGITALKLKAKEGLSIINGTQLMTAIACILVHDAAMLLTSMDIISAMSLEALQGSIVPFDPKIQSVRPHEGQKTVAEIVRKVLTDSSFVDSSERIQDPYSLRCIPQVHGAFREFLDFSKSVILTEINSVTDNPIVFPDSGELISGGNFHGQIVSIALDLICVLLAEASVISERRIDKLLSGFNPNLPIFLVNQPGLNSGLMVSQYSAAALVARNRVLARPASLDSASVSAGQEDHASMGVNAGLKALEVFENTLQVLAIEAINAAQALDLLDSKNKRKGSGTTLLYNEIRKLTAKVVEDRSMSADIQRVARALKSGVARVDLDQTDGYRES
ncbi:MAG: histidine ammonia-lyase [Nitrososphaerales archaeon]